MTALFELGAPHGPAGFRTQAGLRGRTECTHLVGVVGLGYVGLPTALGLAESGVTVLGCDISEARLAAIKAQQVDLLAADRARLDRSGARLVLDASYQPECLEHRHVL